MVAYMNRIIDLGIKANELTVEERNLLSVGYKNMMSVRRTAFRTVQSFAENDPDQVDNNQAYKNTISEEVFDLIKKVLLPLDNSPIISTIYVFVFLGFRERRRSVRQRGKQGCRRGHRSDCFLQEDGGRLQPVRS